MNADPPPGFGLRLSPRVHVCDGGRTLVGGGRVVRLSAPAAMIVEGLPGILGDDPVTGRLARSLLDRGLADPWWPGPAGADARVRDVTVVVPTQDRAPAVAVLLAALPSGMPVIVVDDGSDDPSALELVCRRHGVRLLRHDRNRGPAAARNTGLRAVRTPYVAFCDSDVVPQPGWLAMLRRHLDDPAVALVGPRVLGRPATPTDGWIDRYEQARSSLDLGATPARVAVHGEVSYLPSAALVARVDTLGPGFDESMRCGEDVDLVWRLLADGWGVRYEPAAVVRHEHRTSLRAWAGRKAFYGTSAAPLSARHPGAVAPLVASPFTAAVTIALVAQRRWSFPLVAAASAWATCSAARRLDSG
uniref:mycofactocin biosynthesis glycosyltransferase MftF n=1 Tax=Nocardioides jensenii TaxID=1843 RepID=UPI00082F8B60